MKAITAVCATGASVPAIVNGRVGRQQRTTNGENAEIKMYLSKLKDLVPFMPKNRKLSKLEIIQHVIDYICDLQSELETSPAVSNFDAAAVLHELQQHDERINNNTNQNYNNIHINNNNHHNNNNNNHTTPTNHHNNNSILTTQSPTTSPTSHQQHQQQLQNIRQPLVDRSSPNLILSASSAPEHHHQHHHHHHHHQQQHQHQSNSNSGHFNHQSSLHTTADKSEGNSRS